jgi:hypothetical protein
MTDYEITCLFVWNSNENWCKEQFNSCFKNSYLIMYIVISIQTLDAKCFSHWMLCECIRENIVINAFVTKEKGI